MARNTDIDIIQKSVPLDFPKSIFTIYEKSF